MPRKSAAKAQEPSSDDASAHSDVEMQDQPEDKMNGFKKFGVSATPSRALVRRAAKGAHTTIYMGACADTVTPVQPRHTRLHSTSLAVPARRACCAAIDADIGLRHEPKHEGKQRRRRQRAPRWPQATR